jgi:hypothetical protein
MEPPHRLSPQLLSVFLLNNCCLGWLAVARSAVGDDPEVASYMYGQKSTNKY